MGVYYVFERFWRYRMYIRIADDREYDSGNFPKAGVFFFFIDISILLYVLCFIKVIKYYVEIND